MKKPIYLFFGEEDFLIAERVGEIKRSLVKDELNFEPLDGRDLDPQGLVNATQISPLLGGEKMVLITNLKTTAELQEPIISALKNLPSAVSLIACSENIDKRSRLYKWFEQNGQVEEFKPFAPWEQNELAAWIKQRAKKSGNQIDEDAIDKLIELCGAKLRLLTSELEKLSVYAGVRKTITLADVAALVMPLESNAFALLDALREKKIKEVIGLFQILYRNREDLLQLLGLITTQYRLMLQIKSLPASVRDPWQAARALGASPYFVKKCMQNINNFSSAELIEDLKKLLDANMRMKTGEAPMLIFEVLLTALCGR